MTDTFMVDYDPKADTVKLDLIDAARQLIGIGHVPIVLPTHNGLVLCGPSIAEQDNPEFTRAMYSETPEAAICAIVKSAAEFNR